MIFGVTHTLDGEPIERPIVNRKLGVGLAPGVNGKNYPTRLDYFIASIRSPRKEDKGAFIPDDEFTKKLGEIYGNPLREVDVVLLSNDPENVLRSEYAWRSQNRTNALQCHGDGRDATRRWEALTDQERKEYGGSHDPKDWIELKSETCGNKCPHLIAKRCKPSADLYFMFPEDPITGSVATLHTGSWEATRRLSSSLYEIYKMVTSHGGKLRGLRLKLVARPYTATFKGKDGDEKSTQLAFNLEFRGNDHQTLLPTLIAESRRLETDLPEAEEVVGLSDAEIVAEFPPEDEQPQNAAQVTPTAPAKPAAALDRLVSEHQPKRDVMETFRTPPPPAQPQQSSATINPDVL